MRKPTLIETRPVALADIHIEARLRPVNPVSVQSLMQSIETVGLQDEVHLRRVRLKEALEDGTAYILRLMAGGHRVQAFLELGHDEIPAKIWDCTDDYAQLMEIDDNLAHSNLEPLDLALFLAERKRVYEEMFPETKWGAKGLDAMNGDQTANLSVWTDRGDKNLSVASFVSSTAAQMGQSERNVFRLVSAAQRLDRETIDQLRASPRRVTHSDLQTLAKVTDAEDRAAVCAALIEGNVKSAADAVKARSRDTGALPPFLSESDKAMNKLLEHFARCNKQARRSFVRFQYDALEPLMAEIAEERAREASGPSATFGSRRGASE